MSTTYNVAVVGATSLVGEALLDLLAERAFPVGTLTPLAHNGGRGETVSFNDRTLRVRALAGFDFATVQIAFFAAGPRIAQLYAPQAAAAGCTVIDNSSAFRYDRAVPLVVPAVNAHAIADYRHKNIIASPACSALLLATTLKPLHVAAGIDRVNVSTYQSVSGSGKKGITELAQQTTQLLNGRAVETHAYSKQIAFNTLPCIDVFQPNGYTKEEMRMVWETQKMMEDTTIAVNSTAVRVPTFYGHAAAVHLDMCRTLSADAARDLLAATPGISVLDERQPGGYPTAVSDSVGKDTVYVGRIREATSHPLGLNLWVVADNVRTGAALNSVQIAERLVRDHL